MTPILIYYKEFFRKRYLSELIFRIFLFGISIFSITSEATAEIHLFKIDSCTDDDKPVISIDIGTCNPASYDTSVNSCMGFLSIKASAFDHESPDDRLSFYYQIDLYNDGKGPFSGYDCRVGPLTIKEFNSGGVPIFSYNSFAKDPNNAFDASGIYPLGTHKICWEVEDTCGNVAKLCQLFEIRDCQAPVPVCLTGEQYFTLPKIGCVTFFAKDFNNGSLDNCTSSDKLIYYFNGNIQDTSYTVCCEDFIAAGASDQLYIKLQVWVQDEEGNSDYCKLIIVIQDLYEVCPGGEGGRVFGYVNSVINGINNIITPKIEARLFINSILIRTSTSNPYLFSDLGIKSYNIQVYKIDDSLNSVNTFDLYLIQKLIKGIDTFSNPYQIITGDVDNNDIIESRDYFEIKNLILGTENHFLQNSAWKLLPIQIDGVPIDTVNENFNFIPNFPFFKKTINFRCFKMGDINDYVSPLNYIPLKTGTPDSLIFKYKNQQVLKGEKIKIDLYANQFDSLVGFQGTIKFDTQKLRYQSISSSALTMDSNGVGIKFLQDGFLTISWNDLYPISYPADTILFSLEFEVLEDGDLCDALSFTSDLTPAEAYTDSVLIKNIKMESCDVAIKNNETVADQIKMYPNPAEEILHFDFPIEVSFPLQIDVYSRDGREIKKLSLPSRTDHYELHLNPFLSGMYFVKLSEKKYVTLKKFIKI